jgi:hypothetical protein
MLVAGTREAWPALLGSLPEHSKAAEDGAGLASPSLCLTIFTTTRETSRLGQRRSGSFYVHILSLRWLPLYVRSGAQ